MQRCLLSHKTVQPNFVGRAKWSEAEILNSSTLAKSSSRDDDSHPVELIAPSLDLTKPLAVCPYRLRCILDARMDENEWTGRAATTYQKPCPSTLALIQLREVLPQAEITSVEREGPTGIGPSASTSIMMYVISDSRPALVS